MDLDVYGLCLGGNVFGWTADRDASFAVLDAYVEAGGNFIDTADTYMRPNMGISETIIGEWMAARGNRDSLVHRHQGRLRRRAVGGEHRRRTPTSRWRGCRPTGSISTTPTRTTGHVPGRGDRARVRRAGARPARSATSRRPTSAGERLVESLELAAREGLAPLRLAAAALQPRRARRLRARVRADRRAARAGRRAVLRAGERLSDRQVPAAAATARQPARREGLVRTSTTRGTAVLAALDEVAAAHGVAGRRGRGGLAAGQAAASPPRSPAPAPWSSSPRVLPAVGLELTADEIARLDEASA